MNLKKSLFIYIGVFATFIVATAQNANYAEFSDLKIWKVSNPNAQQSIELLENYTPRLKVLKLSISPNKQWYGEITPKFRIQLAEDESKLNHKISYDLRCDTPEIFTTAVVRLIDSKGEVFQYQFPNKLNSGQWKHFEFIIDKNLKLNSSWGGNNDKKIDYPVFFYSLVFDGKRYCEKTVSYYLTNIKIKTNK